MSRTSSSAVEKKVPPFRARRFNLHLPLRYRPLGEKSWRAGTTENISRSGVLLRSPSPLEVGSRLELIFEMPHELTGEDDARVVCEGSLLRVEAVPPTRKKQQPSFLLACSITQYKFAPSSKQETTRDSD